MLRNPAWGRQLPKEGDGVGSGVWGASPLCCPHGSQGGRCDLIFLMVLSLVLLGVGLPPLPHTRAGYGGLEALELCILLKPSYKQCPLSCRGPARRGGQHEGLGSGKQRLGSPQ